MISLDDENGRIPLIYYLVLRVLRNDSKDQYRKQSLFFYIKKYLTITDPSINIGGIGHCPFLKHIFKDCGFYANFFS